MASVLKVDKLDPQSGTALEVGTSGDTITVPSGATLTTTNATVNLTRKCWRIRNRNNKRSISRFNRRNYKNYRSCTTRKFRNRDSFIINRFVWRWNF